MSNAKHVMFTNLHSSPRMRWVSPPHRDKHGTT
jgi:hypothetical protein